MLPPGRFREWPRFPLFRPRRVISGFEKRRLFFNFNVRFFRADPNCSGDFLLKRRRFGRLYQIAGPPQKIAFRIGVGDRMRPGGSFSGFGFDGKPVALLDAGSI
jgi:hypothetical protein